MMDEELDRLEAEIIDQIEHLNDLHRKTIEPLARRLAQIRALRPPVFIVPADIPVVANLPISLSLAREARRRPEK